MKCNRVLRLLSRYLDQELGVIELRQLEEHLKGCEECQTELSALRADEQVLTSLQVPEIPVFLAGKVMAEVRAGARVRQVPFWARALPLAAGVVMVAAGAWFGTLLGREFAGNGGTGSENVLTVSAGLSLDDIYAALSTEER